MKLSVALLIVGAASGPRIVSAATVADPPGMQVELPDDVCALAPRVGFPQCRPSPTDPTPDQLRSVAGKGELLFLGKTRDSSCVITLVKTPGFGPASDLRAFEKGARDGAKAQGGTVLELKTSNTKVGGLRAVASTMKLEIHGTVVHSSVYVVEAGDATYAFTVTALDPAVVEAVARTTLGTFRGAKSKRPLLTPYNVGYYGMWVVILVVVAVGCIYAARKRPRAPPQPPWAR